MIRLRDLIDRMIFRFISRRWGGQVLLVKWPEQQGRGR